MMNNIEDIKVKIVEYKGDIIIETLKPEKDSNFIPVTEPGRVGSTLIDTEKFLGISIEAWDIIKNFKQSGDDIGEVMTWKLNDGKYRFGWLGGLNRRIGPLADTSISGIIDIKFIRIQNILNPKIKHIIDDIDKNK